MRLDVAAASGGAATTFKGKKKLCEEWTSKNRATISNSDFFTWVKIGESKVGNSKEEKIDNEEVGRKRNDGG